MKTQTMLPERPIQKQASDETKLVLAEIYKKYKANPVFFVEHCLGHHTWSKQREILLSVASNPRTIVKASHSISKTYTASEVAVWFLNCFPNSKVITTAPTFRQVRDLLWSEINNIYKTSRFQLEGECGIVSIRTERPDNFAIGFSSDKAPSSEGFHSSNILFIFDEAKGIPQWLWESVRGSMTGGNCKWLVVSTTDGVKSGEQFHNIFTNPKINGTWNRISISAYESPYVTGEKFRSIDIPNESRPDIFSFKYTSPSELKFQMASPEWIADCKKEWGEDSVLFLTKVKGEICEKGFDAIAKYSDILQMFENANNPLFKAEGEIEVGVDVARFGDDSTTFFKRKGLKVIGFKTYTKQDVVTTANELKAFVGTKPEDKQIRIKIDDTGVGGGLTDIMLSEGYNVIPVNFNQTAKNPDKYPNAISEMWFEITSYMKDISCPKDERLLVELSNRKHAGLDNKGRRMVESKDAYKKRGFQSPDMADAFLLCFYSLADLRIL